MCGEEQSSSPSQQLVLFSSSHRQTHLLIIVPIFNISSVMIRDAPFIHVAMAFALCLTHTRCRLWRAPSNGGKGFTRGAGKISQYDLGYPGVSLREALRSGTKLLLCSYTLISLCCLSSAGIYHFPSLSRDAFIRSSCRFLSYCHHLVLYYHHTDYLWTRRNVGRILHAIQCIKQPSAFSTS